MSTFNDSFGGTVDAATRRALDMARELELAGLTDPVRAAINDANRSRALQTMAMAAPAVSQLETVRRAAEAHDAFMAKLGGTGALDPRTGMIKLHDPYQALGLDAARRIHEQMEKMQRTIMGVGESVNHARMLAQQRDLLAMAERNTRWAKQLVDHQSELDRLLGMPGGMFGTVLDGARAIAAQSDGIAAGIAKYNVGAAARERIEATMTRMAGLAGSLAMTGPLSAATLASTSALLGRWETRPDLPAEFYRDRAVRTRLYRDAEVDPVVIEADRSTLVEVMVDSGMTEGALTRLGTPVAVVRIGDEKVRIAASRPVPGAFVLIDTVDRTLKATIDATMRVHHGDDWLAQRLRKQPEALERLKLKRKAAMRGGEPRRDLVYYLDLGELMDIVNDNKNWPLFASVFADRDRFIVDMRRLNVIRRPTAHGRSIDQVQLLEVIVAANWLVAAMLRTGAIDEGWDSDI